MIDLQNLAVNVLNLMFPDGISPYQYDTLLVLMCDINELQDTADQIARNEKKQATQEATNPIQKSDNVANVSNVKNVSNVSAKPYITGTYPANFEESPIEPKKSKMGRPTRSPGSLGLVCPKCGSDDVTAGGFGPNKERRIKCKSCGSQPSVTTEEVRA